MRVPRRRRSLVVVATIAVVGGVVAGAIVWRGPGGTTSRQDRFVDAYAAGLAGTEIPDGDASCLGEATVEAVGAATLAEATSLDATRASPALVPSELEITVDESQAEAYYETLRQCTDPRRQFRALLGDLDVDCFDEHIDDGLLRELVIAWFTSAAEISPELDAALTDLYASCATQPTGGRPPVADLAGLRRAQPAGPSVKVISYNVRGLLRAAVPTFNVDPDTRRFTELVGDEVARQQADFVLLQEICESQAQLIAQRSTVLGHPMHVRAVGRLPTTAFRYRDALEICPEVSGISLPPGSPVPYGTVILVSDPRATIIEPPGGAPAQCIRAESPQPVRVCNVHMEEGNPGILRLGTGLELEPLIVGGDFNTTPASDPMPGLYGLMHEADPSNESTAFTPVSYKKIDYIFADSLYFAGSSGGDVLWMRCSGFRFCSDHEMIVGEFAFSTTGFPPQIDVSSQGGSAAAVYLAVTDSYDDPRIAAAEAAARSVGYDAAASDLGCDVGAAEALGRPAPSGAAVAIYFESQEHAMQARATFERRGIPVVGVADVSFICVD